MQPNTTHCIIIAIYACVQVTKCQVKNCPSDAMQGIKLPTTGPAQPSPEDPQKAPANSNIVSIVIVKPMQMQRGFLNHSALYMEKLPKIS